ncbi:peptidylprolyl isomerase [Thalassotalea atypica]|uniref:peptidylprolyl isomerase n=1 Tax=Thalassotalea atypica TaxID=2054316 RepID=UPI002573F271|nr:peptidylprolyl isomerase [Thalassotalea atypica]
MRNLFLALIIAFFSCHIFAESIEIDPDNLFPKVKFETSKGVIIVELDRIKAPLTVNNFLTYVVEGEFNNTIFHRVIGDFIAQGGGYDKDFNMRKVKADIVNESGNGLKNEEGTIAMAKESQPHTANRQFFFNLADNTNLDPGRGWGYTVFGEIVDGLEVMHAIGSVETDYDDNMGWDDVPKEPIILTKVTLLPVE